MVKIIFSLLPNDEKYEAEAKCGQSLMEAAIENKIPRIIGECGGACSCGTCHIYLSREMERLAPPMDALEEDMLSFLDKVKPESRLSCQIPILAEMDGMTVYVP